MRSISRIKQDAKKLAKEKGIKHTEAITQIVKQYGFNTLKAYEKALIAHDTQQVAILSEHQGTLNNNTNFTQQNREILAKLGIEYAIIIPTETGLKKSILDATRSVRELFQLYGYHDYSQQQQGTYFKVRQQAVLLKDNKFIDTKASLYRPITKKGDPRVWFSNLKLLAEANDNVAIIIENNTAYLINISKISIIDNQAIYDFLKSLSSVKSTIMYELLAKLTELSKTPIKAIKTGDTAIGMTIEHALGIEPNSSKQPDYKGIEIKSAREKGYKNRVTLFAQVADWKNSPLKSSKDILQKYGYQRNEELKLYCTVDALKPNSQGLKFELKDNEGLLIETDQVSKDVAIWPYRLLQERLIEKHAETFWINAEVVYIDGIEHFKLVSALYTRSPLVTQLIPLIKEGIITMDHLIKCDKNGRVSEKGPLFKIKKDSLHLIFPEPTLIILHEA